MIDPSLMLDPVFVQQTTTTRYKGCPRCGSMVHIRNTRFVLLNGSHIKTTKLTTRLLAQQIGENASFLGRALKRRVQVHPCVAQKIADVTGLPLASVIA